MPPIALFLHLAAAIVWLGGMVCMVWAVRPAAQAHLQPAARLPLMVAALRRFFLLVWLCIAVLWATGGHALAAHASAPAAWRAMAGIGLVMSLIFAWIWFVPFRQIRDAMNHQDGPRAGAGLARMHPFILTNLVLGWLAVAAIRLWP